MEAGGSEGTPVGRRVVLGLLGLGALGVATGPTLSRLSGRAAGALSPHDPTGLSDLIPGDGWRYYTVTDGFPFTPPSSYRLSVGGLVERQLTMTLEDLRSLPRTRLTRDFQCVTGWRVRGVAWRACCSRDLLDRAGAKPGAAGVRFVSYDGVYTESLSTEQARRDDVLVVDTLDGEPIGRSHGGPARLLVAPMYGYKSCKWLGRVLVTDDVRPGYWEQYGYDQDAWVGRSNGRDDEPVV